MTPRDNLLAVLRREGMTEVPLDLVFSPSQYERMEQETGSTDLESHFRLPHRRLKVRMTGPADPRGLHTRETIPERTRFDPWGVGHSAGSSAAYHMTKLHHPLRGASPAEVVSYPMPTIDINAESSRIAAEVDQIHDDGFAAIGVLEQTVWEAAWAIRSMEDLMVDMASESDTASDLLDRVRSISTLRARIFAEAGCDMIQFGDDVGMQKTTMMSVEFWRRWLKPRLAQVIDEARSAKSDILVFYHSCGFVTPFIEDLIELGMDVLNPVQPECMSFEEVHSRYGNRLSFWGTIGTQTTMPHGSADDVKQEVRKNLSLCEPSGGLVIAPTHMLEPDVPWSNIVALREICDGLSTRLSR